MGPRADLRSYYDSKSHLVRQFLGRHCRDVVYSIRTYTKVEDNNLYSHPHDNLKPHISFLTLSSSHLKFTWAPYYLDKSPHSVGQDFHGFCVWSSRTSLLGRLALHQDLSSFCPSSYPVICSMFSIYWARPTLKFIEA
jgi:hypothetical protein